jgi:hypothetical protein
MRFDNVYSLGYFISDLSNDLIITFPYSRIYIPNKIIIKLQLKKKFPAQKFINAKVGAL